LRLGKWFYGVKDEIAPDFIVVDERGNPVKGVPVQKLARPQDAPTLLNRLRGAPAGTSCLLLVGHNPGLEELIRELAGPQTAALGLPAAGLAIFEISGAWSSLGSSTARLVAFLAP